MKDSNIQHASEPHFEVRPATLVDDEQLRKLIAVPMTTRGVMLSFQREPSYFQASDIVYTVRDHAVIENTESGEVVACYANGYRPCYINGNIQNLRYACDLRVNSNYRGLSLLRQLASHMKNTMTIQPIDYSQIIIFNDNYAARAAVQTGKAGMPNYYDEGLIETITLTGFGSQRKISQFLNEHDATFDQDKIHCCTAESQHIPAMNAFVQKMSQFYNFIPVYDFAVLLTRQNPYFKGLTLADFSLYFKNEQLVGMFGLWDQHLLKQSTIMDYGILIGLARPFYNLFAWLTKGMILPRRSESFKYHALHSLLCEPQHLALHHHMLQDAYRLSRQHGISAISFTLSDRDPKFQLNQFYKGECLNGMHGFVSFEQDPRYLFDAKLIPYIEVGRI